MVKATSQPRSRRLFCFPSGWLLSSSSLSSSLSSFALCAALLLFLGFDGTLGVDGASESRPLLRIAGSGTVYPVAIAWAEAMGLEYTFVDSSGNNTVCDGDATVCAGGSSTGAKRVCADRSHPDHVDVGDMSRDWKSSEAVFLDDGYTLECLSSGIRVTQLTVGVDGLAVVVGGSGPAADCLMAMGGMTLAQLRWIFSDWSEVLLVNDIDGGINLKSVAPNDDGDGLKEWSDLNQECAEVPINPYGPGANSGTGSFFGEEVLCTNCFASKAGHTPESYPWCDTALNDELESLTTTEEIDAFMSTSRPTNCYMASQDDDYDKVSKWVQSDTGGIAYFGFAYYNQNSASLGVVRIASDAVNGVQDTTDALITPSSYTIVDGSYSVFTRKLFMNVDNQVWDLVQPYMTYGFSDEGMGLVAGVGYININAALKAKMIARVAEGGNPTADYVPVAPESCETGTELIATPYINDYGTAKVAYECRPCQIGYFKADTSASSCTACIEGTYASTTGHSTCDFCDAGSYSHAGSANCTFCPLNTHSTNPGSGSCASCSEGFVTSEVGAVECTRCSLGTYRNENMTECVSCPSQMTTEYRAATALAECGCSEGLFLAQGGDLQGPCQECPEGMTCAFHSEYANFELYEEDPSVLVPLLDEQYWSDPEDPLSVYLCKSEDDICPGGLPGQCIGGRIGLVCALCPDEYTWNSDDRECQKCSAGYNAVIWLAVLLMTGLILFAYYFGNSIPRANVTIATAGSTCASQILTITQILSMYGDLNVSWPVSVRNCFEGLAISVGSRNIGFECFLSKEAVSLYSFRCMMPIIFIAELILLFMFSKALVRILKALSPNRRTITAWTVDGTLNTAGQILQGLFIGVAAIVVVPLQCYSHPNGMASMSQYPQVLCWDSGEHTTLLGFGIGIALLFVIPFIVWCIYGTWAVVSPQAQAPQNGANMIQRYRFLLFRFRADVWWWGDVFLCRQLLLAFAPSLPADTPQGQSIYVIITLILYGFAQSHFWPWKAPEFNVLDIFTTAGLVVVITVSMALMPSSKDEGVYEGILLACLLLLAIGSGILMLFIIHFMLRLRSNTASFGADRKALSDNVAKKLYAATEAMGKNGVNDFLNTLDQMSYYDRVVLVRGIDAYTASRDPVPQNMLMSPSSRVLGLKRTDAEETAIKRGNSKDFMSPRPSQSSTRSINVVVVTDARPDDVAAGAQDAATLAATVALAEAKNASNPHSRAASSRAASRAASPGPEFEGQSHSIAILGTEAKHPYQYHYHCDYTPEGGDSSSGGGSGSGLGMGQGQQQGQQQQQQQQQQHLVDHLGLGVAGVDLVNNEISAGTGFVDAGKKKPRHFVVI